MFKILNMKKLSILLCFLACSVFQLSAQDFLTPCSYGVWGDYGYDETLAKTLLIGNVDNPWDLYSVDRMSILSFYLYAPSFSPEHALILDKDRLILNKATENLFFCISAEERIHHPEFLQMDKVVRKSSRKLAKILKSKPVETYIMTVPRETIDELDELFKHATNTSNFFNREESLDGYTCYFNHFKRLASVWVPEDGRAGKLVSMAENICYAVEHHDTTMLNQQMEVCRSLTQDFKKEYPLYYFKPRWAFLSTRETGPWSCELRGNHSIGLELLSDTPTSLEHCDSMLVFYNDIVAEFSRDIFLIPQIERDIRVVIDKHQVNALCKVEQDVRHVIIVRITVPEKYWLRNVILEAAQLPIGEYYIDITCLDQTSGLYHWRKNP